MITLDGLIGYTPGEEFKVHTSKRWRFGTQMWDPWTNRKWRYGLNGATLAVVGTMHQGPAPVTVHLHGAIQAAVAVGATSIPITLVTTNMRKNKYDDGIIYINEAGGNLYIIDAGMVPPASVSATVSVPLKPQGGVQQALTTSNTYDLIANPWSHTVIAVHAAAPSAQPVGVLMAPLLANTASGTLSAGSEIDVITSYGWYQTHGPASILADGTLVKGAAVTNSANTDGSASAYAAGTAETTSSWGYVLAIGATTRQALVYLEID